LIEATFRRKKTTHPNFAEVLGKNFELDRSSHSREKGGKPLSFPSKIGFEKKSKQ
jgi:hypothetical protein